MTPAELLVAIRAEGAMLMLKSDGETIRVTREAGPLRADLMEALRARKPEVVALLRARQERAPWCRDCENLRMTHVPTSAGWRFMWGCAHGHMEHGHTTPELHALRASLACEDAGHFEPIPSAASRYGRHA